MLFLCASDSGSDSPEGVSSYGGSGNSSGSESNRGRGGGAGRPGNASGSDESPPSYGGNDSSDEAGDQMIGLSRSTV
jgi:hypothetical protein